MNPAGTRPKFSQEELQRLARILNRPTTESVEGMMDSFSNGADGGLENFLRANRPKDAADRALFDRAFPAPQGGGGGVDGAHALNAYFAPPTMPEEFSGDASSYGIDAYDGDGYVQTKYAIQILEKYQKELSSYEIKQGVEEFKHYLEDSKDGERKILARRALKPLLESESFTFFMHVVEGKTFIARLWKLSESIQDPNEKINARETMISALAASFEDGMLDCNQGTIQRLCATLAHFEELELMLGSTGQLQFIPSRALEAFNAFCQKIHGGGGAGGGSKEQSKEVLSLVESFCEENPLVNKLSLIASIRFSDSSDAAKREDDEERFTPHTHVHELYEWIGLHINYKAMNAFKRISEEEQESILQYAKQLSERLGGNDKAKVIKILLRLPTEERERFTEWAEPLLEYLTLTKNNKVSIVEAFAKVPERRRDVILDRILMNINRQMLDTDIVNIIERENEDLEIHEEWDAVAPATIGIDVHRRDGETGDAVKALYQKQGTITQEQINQAIEKMTIYLVTEVKDKTRRENALMVLNGPKLPKDSYGPLIDSEGFSLSSYHVNGEELIARLWMFIESLSDENDRANAKIAMVSALVDSLDSGKRVCNQGKAQRLVVAVLAGRLDGVALDIVKDMKLSAQKSCAAFFGIEKHQELFRKEDKQGLLEAAESFCAQNPLADKQGIIDGINEAAKYFET